MRGHVVLSLKQLAGNSSKVPENVLCPAVIVSPAGTSGVEIPESQAERCGMANSVSGMEDKGSKK